MFADYSDYGSMLLTMWQMVLGHWDLTQLMEEGGWEAITLIIFSGFMFISNIVLLNSVIALMYDVYARVRASMGPA